MTGYTETLRRWAVDLRRSGPLEDADGIGEVGLGAEEAGRRLAVRFYLKVLNGAIETARFEVFGCGFTIAACAAAADLAEGRSLAEAASVTAQRIDALLDGLPLDREYCAALAAEALQAAVASASGDHHGIRRAVAPEEQGHGARVDSDDPLYRQLMATARPSDVTPEDRHLFACLLSVVAQEPYAPAEGLGIEPEDLDALFATCFPAADRSLLPAPRSRTSPPERNDQVLGLLLGHARRGFDGRSLRNSRWLAHIIAARAAHPGHLWVAMGLFDRPELTAAIRRHLPSLAAANHKGMRWKRYLFRQVCELNGGVMCKAPNCGECSDYALCFGDDS